VILADDPGLTRTAVYAGRPLGVSDRRAAILAFEGRVTRDRLRATAVVALPRRGRHAGPALRTARPRIAPGRVHDRSCLLDRRQVAPVFEFVRDLARDFVPER